MRHRLASLLLRVSEWLDHTHCPFCGTDDRMCCVNEPLPAHPYDPDPQPDEALKRLGSPSANDISGRQEMPVQVAGPDGSVTHGNESNPLTREDVFLVHRRVGEPVEPKEPR